MRRCLLQFPSRLLVLTLPEIRCKKRSGFQKLQFSVMDGYCLLHSAMLLPLNLVRVKGNISFTLLSFLWTDFSDPLIFHRLVLDVHHIESKSLYWDRKPNYNPKLCTISSKRISSNCSLCGLIYFEHSNRWWRIFVCSLC